MVRRLNIDRDGQGDLAGHAGEHRAVMVYQLDSCRYWQAHLGRNDFVCGQFGENFTVEGLSDDEVSIGAGDEIIKIADGPEHVTLAEIDDYSKRSFVVGAISSTADPSLRIIPERITTPLAIWMFRCLTGWA
jgi:hypothetical protein